MIGSTNMIFLIFNVALVHGERKNIEGTLLSDEIKFELVGLILYLRVLKSKSKLVGVEGLTTEFTFLFR